MIKTLAATVMASALTFSLIGAAQAQVVVPPGQDFEATPMSKGEMTTMPVAKIAMAPAGKKMMKKHMMKKHMMKKKMMKKGMMKKKM